MDCICGCGTKVPKRLVPTNLLAWLVALELAEWDKLRTMMGESTGQPFDNLNIFIDDGALCYERMLAVLHEQQLHSSPRDTKRWRKFSRKRRKEIARETGLIDGSKDVEFNEEMRGWLNLQAPWESYSAPEPLEQLRAELADAQDAEASDDPAAAGDG